ncbi:MAG: hypothetical protein Ct9H300mP18_07130 [Candidatus Neomarinimicrobiota bacterium]|nr:MAG: hypothetical protein Ct9H300mP18_07130 [Candidatus Neomarinimicrobiota bacterium]
MESVYNDTSSETGNASIAHYIKKIFVVSDDNAFNRIYEFLGQDYFNNECGLSDIQISVFAIDFKKT